MPTAARGSKQAISAAFTRYLRDYLVTERVFDDMIERLEPVIHLKTRDEAARRRARRKYVRTILNDFVMNPGPSLAAIKAEDTEDAARRQDGESEKTYDNYGLMGSFVGRWASRMPAALALKPASTSSCHPATANSSRSWNRLTSNSIRRATLRVACRHGGTMFMDVRPWRPTETLHLR